MSLIYSLSHWQMLKSVGNWLVRSFITFILIRWNLQIPYWSTIILICLFWVWRLQIPVLELHVWVFISKFSQNVNFCCHTANQIIDDLARGEWSEVTVLAIGSVGFKVRIPTYEPVPCQRTDFFSYFDKLIISTFIVHTSIYFLHSENISLHPFITTSLRSLPSVAPSGRTRPLFTIII